MVGIGPELRETFLKKNVFRVYDEMQSVLLEQRSKNFFLFKFKTIFYV
jgi:hypothetical protein